MAKPNPLHDPLARDFRVFLTMVWRHLGLPDPTPVQLDIAHYMQFGPKRSIIEAFRGVGKSWMFSAFICWRLYCDPDWKIEIVSASKNLADSISTFVKRLIREIPVLQHLQPDPSKGHRDSNFQFDVGPAAASKDPSVKSVGITGQITGSRADEILADDIEVPNNSATQLRREQLRERVKEFGAIAKPETGYIRFLGTPQVEDSLYSWLVDQTAGDVAGFKMRIWPAEVPADPSKYGDRLAPFVATLAARGTPAGTPVCSRFTPAKLASEGAFYGRTGYALQFMLDTSLSDMDKFPLRLGDLIVFDVDPDMAPAKFVWASSPDQHMKDLSEFGYGLKGDRLHRPMFYDKEHLLPYTATVMYIDPSGRGADETAYAIVRFVNGYLFLVASGGMKSGYDEATLTKLANLAKLHQVNTVKVESNFGDGMFMKILEPVFSRVGYPVEFLEERAKTAKEARIIEILEPILAQHKLVVDPKVIEMDARSAMAYGGERWREYTLTHQMTRITKERGALAHDDRLDALAGACNHFLELMTRNSDQGIQEAKDAALDAALEEFVNEFGTGQQMPAWLNGLV
jgi:hypothetical protein